MKKYTIINIILLSIILVGCSIANTPTSKVEDLLGQYQRLDKMIKINYTNLSNEQDISLELQKKYEELIKDQYQKMSYEIKEEEIDGNIATVTTSIEVIDYKEIINKYNKNEYTTEEYHNLIIGALKKAKTKVNYTIDFTLTKDTKDNWNVDDLTNEMKEKLLGIN